jgi:hypothetical protein
MILAAAIIAVLYVLSHTLDTLAQAVPYHSRVLLGITAFQGLLVLIAFIANPLDIFDSLGGSASWAFGAFFALIAAIAAVAGAVLGVQEDKRQRAVSPALPDTAEG